ncbi:MAG: glycosyltransferase [Fimbriimonadaceae bacterium]|nr:glycosyltransferase [Fimbriimonadaceae bacterium]
MSREKLRIAIFSDSALPILNGVSISIDALVRGLRNAGHSVHVYTAAAPGYKDSDPNTYRFWAMETPWTKGYPLVGPFVHGILGEFRKNTYDVIHTHTPFTVGFMGLRWADSHEIPIVSTYHTLYDRYAHYIPFFPRRYVRFKIAKHTSFYYNSVRHVIVPSEAAKKWLRRHAVTTPIKVIPTGAPDRQMIDRSEARARLGIHPVELVMLYVGRIAKEKNLSTLFEMAALAMREEPNLRLILVGDGPYREEAREMVRGLGIGDRVRFAGFLPRAEVDQFYSAADLFVFSSISETQGLVLQEAMTYGVPAVAVVGGGASETIVPDVNGYTVKNDPTEFAGTILKVLNDEKLYAKLSQGSLQTVRGRGSEAMVESVVEVYRRAMRIPTEKSKGGRLVPV